MENFNIAEDALEVALNSSGSALKEHAKWSESLEAKLLKLKATWQSLSQSFMSSDFLKGSIDVIIALVDAIDKLIQAIGPLPTLLAGFVGFKVLFTSISGLPKILSVLTSSGAGSLFTLTNLTKLLTKSFPTLTPLITKFTSALKGLGAGSITGGIKAVGKVLLNLVTTHPYITAAVAAVTALTWIFTRQKKEAEDLAKEVEELTSKYKEEHDALKKLEGDYDTSNESSMVSRYAKLSKGVDGLGRNVSLTVDEYSEYQDIVNKIAEQFPSMISGYDEQGNAILSCKGNVEQLTEAYEKLIHAQNQEILSSNAGDIERNWKNVVSQANGYDFWESLGNGLSFDGIFGGKLDVWDMKTSTAEWLGSLTSKTSKQDIGNALANDVAKFNETVQALQSAGYDVSAWSSINTVSEVLKNALEKEPQKIRGILDGYYSEFDGAVSEYKTKANALLSEAFDVSSSISGLNYGNISEELQAIAYQTVNSLDFDFLNDLSTKGVTIEKWTKSMLDSLNSLSSAENKKIETGFELQTKFNGGDISYGQYINQLKDTVDFIDKDLKVPEEVKNQIKLSLNSEDVLTDYKALVHDLKNIGFDDTAINKFLNSLSAEEYSAAMTIVPKLDAGTTISEIQAMIDEKLAAEFEFSIEVQTEGIEAFNAALSESRSATGLTSESLKVLQARYKDLDGYNAAALFEKTANGIHLNNEELSRLEEQYVNTNKLEIDKNLNKLITKYQDLTEKIKTCTDAQEKENLQLQADYIKDRIEEVSTWASQYDGLTSAFSKWQTALEGAEEGDNYDSLYENLEGIKELYDKGLVGTDKFKTAVQLMSDEDLSTASIDELVSAYKEGYPKMQRYFTEGQKGCKNFLNDVSRLNSEWAHMNKDGSWEINFNAEEVAKELGVSVDFVLQIAKKLKDYGFEVNLEDSSVDNLKTKIEQTEAKLKELGQSPVDINVDIEANAENLGTIEAEIEKAKAKIQEINNSSVEPNIKTAQLEDAQAKLEALIDKKIEASQPTFMSLNTSQVSASLVDALEKVQAYQNAINEVNKLLELKEAGIKIDDSQLKSAQEKVDECAKAIQGLDGDVKVAIGLEEDGSIDSIKKAFEEGKVKIDANTDPALTKIEQLAENVERIEDKDVTINVTVNGLDEVKELNKQINLATDIDGDIDKLSEYVESAKALSSLDDNIASFVTAEVNGNVTKTPEFELNNLETFADGANKLKETGSFSVKVAANVEGNVIETPEYMINNLEVFSDSIQDLKDIGVVKSEVTADVKGNVVNTPEYMINNLEAFTESAKGVDKIGDVKSEVEANVKGNVTETHEFKLNNLKTFTDSAKDIDKTGNVSSEVKAEVKGNVIDQYEFKLNNLEVFTDSAKDVDKIGDVKSTVEANVKGNVTDTFEYKINNLETFSESAKDIESIGDVSSSVEANVSGNVIDTFEMDLNNLKVFTDSAKDVEGIGNVKSSVEANVSGNVVEEFEYKINNLKTYSDSAKDVESIGNVESSVKADVSGNVVDTFEYKINNLKAYADSAKDLDNIGTVESKATVNIGGNVIDEFEYKIDNLKAYSDNAKDLKNIGTVTSEATANIGGNIIDTYEYKINNLKTYSDSAKDIKSIGTVESSVKADVSGNVIDTKEYKIDNLELFGESAKKVKGIGTVNSSVTADVSGNVINTFEEKLDNLEVFAKGANKLKGTGDVSSNVTANINGNFTNDSVARLEHFVSIVNGLPADKAVNLSVTANVESEKINQAITLLQSVANSGIFRDYSATVQVGAEIATIDDTVVKNYKAPDKKGKVSYSVDENSPVFTWKAPDKDGVVNYDAKVEALTDSQKHKTGTITYKVNVEGLPIVNGTANVGGTAFANGTSGKAYRQGDWGAKRTETALTGELGPELVVYKNKYWTVGDNGAEFAKIPKGAIVFNHRQTEELFANGKVTSGGGRGRALANGTAYAEGTAYVTGSGRFYNSVTGGSYGSKSKDKDSEPSEETLDWIEVKLQRIQRAIDKLDQKASNVYKSWSSRNSALKNEITEVRKEISAQQAAYDKYMQAANAVGLSSSWAKKVRDGSISISTITDDALKEKISDYTEWYNKAIECKDAIEELKKQESELYAQRVKNAGAKYDGALGVNEYKKSMLEERISQSEAQGWLVSEKYYKAIRSNENARIKQLKNQRDAMKSELASAMKSGTIQAYSEGWYELVNQIDEVNLAIEQSNTQIKELDQTIQQLKWEQFDILQDRISSVAEEADFLIELLSSEKLYDDKGNLTDEGMSVAGLHGTNYETYMRQSELAGKEAARLKKELAKDPYDTDLEERYREMVKLQQDYILSAQNEKEAIRDLVEEGISLELDALDELIKKKNEALDAERDLYEYQKKVEEQTKNIASLEKQLAAYEGDDSEEAAQKIQQIKMALDEERESLRETEYDKLISDTSAMLDSLSIEYSELLNTRLDSIDALIADMTAQANNNTSTIVSTIDLATKDVGYELSTSMDLIWGKNTASTNSVLTTYGDRTNASLDTIKTNLTSIVNSLNSKANTSTPSVSEDSKYNTTGTYKNPASSGSGSSSGGGSGSSSGKSYPYGKASSTTGIIGQGATGNKVKAIQYALNQLGYGNSGTTSLDGKYGSGTASAVRAFQKATGASPDGIVGDETRSKFRAKGYASGKEKLLSDELAWTQEKGRELIVRPSDGAILTPVAKGDSVLNATATGNIWNMANNPAEFIKNNLNLSASGVPNNSNSQSVYSQNIEKVVFDFPNAKNYEEILYALKTDRRFEKLVDAMTVNKMVGGSSLAKNKSIR